MHYYFRSRRFVNTRTLTTLCFIALGGGACTTERSTVETDDTTDDVSADAVADAAVTTPDAGSEPTTDEPGERVYIGSTRVFASDGSQGYMYKTSSLSGDEEVDLGEAIEMDDAWVFGNADPYFYTAAIFSPVITQWSLNDNNEFVEGPSISFANEGVGGTYTAAFTPLFAKDKAYFVDGASGQVVVWDPENMHFLKTIPIDVELPEGHEGPADLTPNLDIAVRENEVLVSVFWSSESSFWTETGSFTRLIAIDPQTDEVTNVSEDDRCQSLAAAGTTSQGTTYYTPWDYLATIRGVYGQGFGSASCGLRVVASDLTYDADYEVDLSTLVGGRPAGGAVLLNDEEMLLHVWNEELADATPDNWVESGRWETAYQWYRWKIGEPTATIVPGQQPSGEGGNWGKVDGRLITYNANSEYTETTLMWLDEDGSMSSGLKVPGWTVATIRAK